MASSLRPFDPLEEKNTSLGRIERPLHRGEVSDFVSNVVQFDREETAVARSEGFEAVRKLGFFHKSSATISFKQVSFSVKVKDAAKKQVEKVILEPTSGVIRPGKISHAFIA